MEFHGDVRPLCLRQIVFFPCVQERDLSAQLELEFQNSLQLQAANQELRELVALLPHRLATPAVGHTTSAPYGIQREQRAQEETREKEYLGLLLQVSLWTVCICSRRCLRLWLRSWLSGVLSWASGSLC